MKAEEQTLLNGILSTIFKLDEEQLSKLYNEDGDLIDVKLVTDADEKRVAKFKKNSEDQLKRGIKEGAEKIEKEIKVKYGIESDAIGVELVDSIVVKQVTEATKEGNKDISKHPEYIKLQTSITDKLKERDKEWDTKLKARETEFNREKLFDKVKDLALVNFDARKPILPADPKKAQAWKETYLNELKAGNYQEGENGSIIVLNKEGKAMEDEHGHPVTFDQFEKSISDKYFEYPVAEKRDSPGNKPPVNPSGTNGDPKTREEAIAKLRDPKITAEDRQKIDVLMKSKSWTI